MYVYRFNLLKVILTLVLLLKLQGEFVNIMCEVNGEHRKHVRKENGTDIPYMMLLRSIYGCIEADMLWYNL